MKKNALLIFVLFLSTISFAQETINVPAESIKSFWIENPTTGSTYEWALENGGGEIISGENTEKIFIEFDATEGTSTVWVREINTGGCIGEKSFIDIVRFKGANATFAITGETSLCYENEGSELTVTFTGTPPFKLMYKEGGPNIEIISNSKEYKIAVPAITKTTTYELISVKDSYGVETPLSESVTIEVLPQLQPLKIIHD